ncbi:MAG: FAD:protein FMN transferase [Verrucomicrobia bacterium]|nr:FAD:protein FMN transferase [Verrucomicrobiota bacterium]
MGVPFRIILYAPNPALAAVAAREAFRRIEQLNMIFSDYEEDSEVSRLCATAGTGRAVHVSEDLWRLLRRALDLSEQTDGAFDVTVGPYSILWRRARRRRRLPDPSRMAAAARAVGRHKIKLFPKERAVELTVPGMKLDFGGLAKGYAVDEAARAIRRRGLTRFLVAGAGDLRAGAPPPGSKGWRVNVPGPATLRTNSDSGVNLSLVHCAAATSGDLFQYVVIGGVRYSHIVNPKTGLGLTDHSMVTVLAPECATADGLATSISVLGPQAGMALLCRRPGAEAQILRHAEGRPELFRSAGFEKRICP